MKKIAISIVMLGVFILLACIPVNAIQFTNGGMENWTNGTLDGWDFDPYLAPYINSVTATPNTDAHSGDYSAKITTTYSPSPYPVDDPYYRTVTVGTWMSQGWSADSNEWINVPDGGATVNFSAWIKFLDERPYGNSMTLTMYMFDANNERVDPEYRSPAIWFLHEGWNYFSLTPTDIFTTCDHIAVTLSWGNYVEGQTFSFLVDDVNLSIVPKYPPSNSVPEPSFVLLLGAGLFGLVGLRKKE